MYNADMASLALVQNTFFFLLLAVASFLMWKLFVPFWGILALAAIIVTICFPLHRRVQKVVYKQNETLAAFASLFVALFAIILPLTLIGSFLLRETVSVYAMFNTSSYASFTNTLSHVEGVIKAFVPEFSLDISSVVAQVASFIASHLVSIFAGTASTVFYFLITLIATFYFFKDGERITKYLVKLSPLKDGEDSLILDRLAVSVRSVALGTILVALIQGILTCIGLWLFGFDRAVLWGVIGSLGALVPGVGTSIVFVPAIVYLIATGSYVTAGGVAVWAIFAVGLIDNILGPYLMSRGNPLHPFVILLSVLGGIALMGPIGFILGPVVASLFTVLVELFASHVRT
jgi:predicted PurR-regulated permease PerM